MRERPIQNELEQKRHRITPARAGKTGCESAILQDCGDHPRSCGKDFITMAEAMADRGSPPLVRERLRRISILSCRVGITPARAGKTHLWLSCPVQRQNHPRSCGKDVQGRVFLVCNLGSPPLVRERRTALRCPHTYQQDHPRSCGKDHDMGRAGPANEGSPPLVRERLQKDVCDFVAIGITPARAGKTQTLPTPSAKI